jgi:hypothetical protein
VIFSYVLIISAKIIPLGDQFIEPLISIDGFYIQQLGGFFWVFLAILYFGNSYFLWYGRKSAVEFAGCVLAVFYLFAEIDCVDILKRENTFQKLGYTLSEIMLNANRDGMKNAIIQFISRMASTLTTARILPGVYTCATWISTGDHQISGGGKTPTERPGWVCDLSTG